MCRITRKERLNSTSYDFTVHAPKIAREASAGQFVHILVDGFTLRRPISICEIDGEMLRFVVDVVGEGTAEMVKREVGDEFDILGPLGKGFDISGDGKALVIGGGIGTYPLVQLVKELQGGITVALGFRNEELVVMRDEFDCETHVVTDGFVTDYVREKIDVSGYERIYACGPKPMLAAVAKMAEGAGIWCEVSMEERMACGIGACVGCVTMTIDGYKCVCKDGPVFRSDEILWK